MPNPPKTIEKIWYWWDYNPDNVVGATTFYCDGSSSTTGFVSGEYNEEYFGC
jgi:hypothetical protein